MLKGYAAFILMLSLLCSPARSQEYLEPERGIVASSPSLHMQYLLDVQKILLKNLSQKSLFRMVCLPSFASEWVVDVGSNRDEEYAIIAVRPDKQIWSSVEMPDGKKPMKPETMKILTARVKTDSQTANRIHRVIQKMLVETRYSPDGGPGLDGVSYHFSSWCENIGTRFGQTWSPTKESEVNKLVVLGELLYKYAIAEKSNQLAEEIDAQLKMFKE